MSANSIEMFTAQGFNKLRQAERTHHSERRSRVRLQVHWSVLLFRTDPPEVVESVTENLTSRGFYCFSKVPLVVGETMTCAIRIPAHDPGKEMDRQLDCTVRVTRVEAGAAEGLYGIACRLEDYHVAGVVDPDREQ